MKYLVQIFICFFLCVGAYGQSPDSLGMRSHFLWDKATLPSDGSVKYNDCWGWVDSDGTEYAILGNVDSIFFIDITIPTSPVVVDSFYGGSRSLWRDFKTYGDYCYMVADENSEGLTIFDMSSLPDSVTLVDQNTDFFLRAHNIFIDTSSGRLYALGTNSAAAREGLVILDIDTDPENPDSLLTVQLDSVRNDGNMTSDWYYVHDAYVRNDTVYASHGNLGYFIWDCTDLDSIKLLASYEDDNPGYNHSSWNTEDNSYAFFAAEVPRGVPIHVLELTGLSENTPPQLDTMCTFKHPLESPAHVDNTPHNPFVKDDTLIISYYEDGVQVFDITDINNISRIAYYDTETSNTSYHGTTNNWGVYPFFPSGTIIASDTEYGMFVLEIDLSIVPVSWVNIDAKRNTDGTILISWSTGSEINNAQFIIERSNNGKDFSLIGEVAPKGSSNSLNEYEFKDLHPYNSTNYYRIKQVDFGGNYSYSEIVQVSLPHKRFSFKLFPNPSSDGNFKLEVTNPDKLQIRVIDLNGKLVRESESQDYSGFTSVTLSPDFELTPGIYFIQLISNGWPMDTQRLIITDSEK